MRTGVENEVEDEGGGWLWKLKIGGTSMKRMDGGTKLIISQEKKTLKPKVRFSHHCSLISHSVISHPNHLALLRSRQPAPLVYHPSRFPPRRLLFHLLHVAAREEAKVTQLSTLATMKVFEISNETTLSLALFTDVTNSKELLELMQAGTLEPEVAFLNASLIPDVFPLLAAAHKTLVSKLRESLTTRTLHSELVYNYSGSKHITESLKRCGISDSLTYVLAARFNASPDEMKAVEKLINGKEIDLEELEGRADKAHIHKHYKITAVELGISSLADAITCRIAARDAL
ncbi:hypothetical protein Dsin_027093 [Dipteronia sinensis]|uniref:Uncharacterized protein n=1 Tax=Dipteronia sinensis TaxID=43782 RepID=A0AAE0DYN2_9ROSI|nr:hypothetical protein Dsin_027093 [Dipteronia sinensis]